MDIGFIIAEKISIPIYVQNSSRGMSVFLSQASGCAILCGPLSICTGLCPASSFLIGVCEILVHFFFFFYFLGGFFPII